MSHSLPQTLVLLALAATASAAPSATAPAYVGTFVYHYPGFVVRAEVIEPAKLRWTILEGGPVGKTAEETVDRREVAAGVYLTSWTEADGAAVTQVANYNTMRVVSTLVANGKRLLFEGSITRESK